MSVHQSLRVSKYVKSKALGYVRREWCMWQEASKCFGDV